MDQLITQPIAELAPADIAQNIVKLETLSKQIKARLDEYKDRLMEEMKEKQVLSLKLETMTVSRAKRKTVKVTDDALLEEALAGLGHQVITKKIVDMDYMKPVVTSILEAGELNGASMTETEYITVRLAK